MTKKKSLVSAAVRLALAVTAAAVAGGVAAAEIAERPMKEASDVELIKLHTEGAVASTGLGDKAV